ncbi:MAG: HAD-IB family phosphatase [Candidatus Saccharimonadales bacterium]
MTKPIALFDIDNTLYEGFSYFGLLKTQVIEGIIDTCVLADATTSMQKYKAGIQDYETTIVELLDIYANGLRGKRYDVVLESTRRIYRKSMKFFSYAEPTIDVLRDSHDIALVTGEPQFAAQAVAEFFGLESYYCTVYEVKHDKFTGNIKSYLASRHEKHDAIKHLMHGHRAQNSFAFGDSEGDIEMLRAVQYPICLNCTDGLRDIATKEHWYLPGLHEVEDLVKELMERSIGALDDNNV